MRSNVHLFGPKLETAQEWNSQWVNVMDLQGRPLTEHRGLLQMPSMGIPFSAALGKLNAPIGSLERLTLHPSLSILTLGMQPSDWTGLQLHP